MNKCKNIKIGLAFVLVLQLVLSPFSGASFAYLSGYELSRRISSALDAMNSVWWSPGSESPSTVSLLSSTTRDVQNKTFNPCVETQRSFIVQGYNFLVSSDDTSNLTKVTTAIKTKAVVQQINSDDTYTDKDVSVISPLKNITPSPDQNPTIFSSIDEYYRYAAQTSDTRYFATLAAVFEPQDQVGFKFQVKTNELPIGKFRVVVSIQRANESDWYTSAIIPFCVERDNVFVLTNITNGGSPAPDSGFGTAVNPTWKVEDRQQDDTVNFEGYFLSGKLDSNKNPVSIKELEISMNTMGNESVSTKIYDTSGTDNVFLPMTQTDLDALPSHINANVNYHKTVSNPTIDDQRYYCRFRGQLTLTSQQMSLDNRYNIIYQGLKKVTFSTYRYEPGSPRGSLVSSIVQNINLDIPAKYTSQALTAGGDISVTGNNITQSSGKNIIPPTTGDYVLTLDGYYRLVGNTRPKRVEVTAAGNGDEFATPLIYSQNGQDQTVTTATYYPFHFNGSYTLHMSKLYGGSTGLAPIVLNINIVDDLNKQYHIVKTLYSQKPDSSTTYSATQSTVVLYELEPVSAATPRVELTQDRTQTLEEAKYVPNMTNGIANINVEGLILTGTTPGTSQNPRFGVTNVRAVTSLNKTGVVSDTSLDLVSSGADYQFISEYYPNYNSTTNNIYRYNISIPINFKTVSSGKVTLAIQAQLRDLATNKLSALSATRTFNIHKLGEGETKNTVSIINVPKNNDTITLPAITSYNRSSNITIPLNGMFLDGSYKGVESIKIFVDNKYVKTVPAASITEIEDNALPTKYKAYTKHFDSNGSPSSTGTITRGRINVSYNGDLTFKNSDRTLSSSRHVIKVVVRTYDGRNYNLTRSIRIARFKELHAPTISATNSGASVSINVYDVDLDLNTQTIKYEINGDGSKPASISRVPSNIVTNGSITTCSAVVSIGQYIHIEATDKTGRKTYYKYLVK